MEVKKLNKKNLYSLSFKGLMFAFLFSLVFSVAVCPCASAVATWSRTYGGANYDRGSGETFQTSDGGYIVSCDSNSSGAGGLDFWLFRTDAVGNMLWDKTYGGVEDETIGEMCLTSDGGYALAGGTYSYGAGDQDVWLVKTDASGNMQWSNTYGGSGYDYGFSVCQANDGGYAIFGVTESFGAGGQDFYFVKTDPYGNMEWQMTYGGSGTDYGTNVCRSTGGYTISGYTTSFGDSAQYWLGKTDLNGVLQWNYTYGFAGTEQTTDMKMTSDGGYALFGYTSMGGFDAYLVKTDAAGNMEWNKTYSGPSLLFGTTGIQTSDGGYAIVAYGSFPGTNYDCSIYKVDAAGNTEWNMNYGGAKLEVPYNIMQTADGGYMVTCTTASYGAGGTDVWLLKIDASGTPADRFPYDWPKFLNDLHQTGYSESPAPETNQTLWIYEAPANSMLFSSAAVADGRLYFTVFGGSNPGLYCLDAAYGVHLWNYSMGSSASSPAVADGKVYAGSGDDNIYCLDAVTGALIWNYTVGDTGGSWASSPAVADGRVYIGAYDNNTYCLDALTGALIWNYTAGDYFYAASPIVADGNVYIASMDYNVYCLDAVTGAKIWNYTTGGEISGTGGYSDGRVYWGSADGNLYCLDAASGTKIWNYTTASGEAENLAIAYGNVYLSSAGGQNVYCLDAATGAKTWNYSTGSGLTSPPSVADGKVYFSTPTLGSSFTYCLNATTGAFIWSYDIGTLYMVSTAVIANGVVYVTAGTSRDVIAFGTEVIPEGLTLSVMLLLSTIAVIVSMRYYRKRPKWQNW